LNVGAFPTFRHWQPKLNRVYYVLSPGTRHHGRSYSCRVRSFLPSLFPVCRFQANDRHHQGMGGQGFHLFFLRSWYVCSYLILELVAVVPGTTHLSSWSAEQRSLLTYLTRKASQITSSSHVEPWSKLPFCDLCQPANTCLYSYSYHSVPACRGKYY
jgi:hypothetical protein